MNNLEESLIKASHSAEFLVKEVRAAHSAVVLSGDCLKTRISEKYLLQLIEDCKKIENALKYFVAKP